MNELEIFREASWNAVERYVSWSGGSDSTVALHLSLRAWDLNPPKVIFIDTGITLPETLDYVQKLTSEWSLDLVTLKAETDFWEYVDKNGFPFFKRLWCRRLLKMTPLRRYLNSVPGWKIMVLGIRRAESTNRMRSPYYKVPFLKHTRLRRTYTLCPMLEWTDSMVLAYMKKHKIPRNPCYDYYETSGCYWCPFVTKETHYLSLKARHPDLFCKLLEAESNIKSGWTVFKDKPRISDMNQQSFLDYSLLRNGGKP